MSTGDRDEQNVEHFATTQWSLVLAAGHRSSPDSRDALAALCQASELTQR